MARTNDIAVLIVGAGPTGLALACDLARRNVSFRIIDRIEKYFVGSRGKGLQPRSLEVLDDFGVIEDVLAGGRFHLPFRGYEGSKVIGDRDPHADHLPTPNAPYGSPLIIPQWRVEEILRKRLADLGGAVELATELTGFEQDADGVDATLMRDGGTECVSARYMVGCDGGRSLVRKILDVGFAGETWATERMYVGDVRAEGLDRDHWHSWLHKEHGWLALCPLPGTDSFQLQAQVGPDEPDEPTLERFQTIVAERTGGMNIRLHDASWLSLYRTNIRMVDRYRVGRVFLAGDAAHVHSPAGGQGMNTGIQDAYNLGWKLGQVLAGGPAGLLDTYEEERLPVAAEMLGMTTKLHREGLSGDTKAFRRGPETLQLGISYRESSLSREERENPGSLQAGDRAPDAPCQDSKGAPVRLFDLFRGPHFTVLTFGSNPSPEPHSRAMRSFSVVRSGEAGSVVDIAGHALRAYDAQDGATFVIRPDGYIGRVTADPSVAGTRAYLHELGAA